MNSNIGERHPLAIEAPNEPEIGFGTSTQESAPFDPPTAHTSFAPEAHSASPSFIENEHVKPGGVHLIGHKTMAGAVMGVAEIVL